MAVLVEVIEAKKPEAKKTEAANNHDHTDEENNPKAQCSKIGKKCNLKSGKTHFLPFQKWQKINFCTRKKFKTTKNAIFGLFSGAKIDFLPFLK